MTTTTEETLNTFFAFFKYANGLLRIAIFIVVLWPIAALLTSIFLPSAKAQTFVPLVDLIPVVALLFLITGTPFAIALLTTQPQARKGFIYFLGLIGAELSFGVYFAMVPVSNDAGLAPLLILASLALFFLWAARIAKGLRTVLILILIGITVVFIAGGRDAAMNAFTPKQPVIIIDNHPAKGAPKTYTVETENPPTNAHQQVPLETAEIPMEPIRPKQFHPDWSNAVYANASDFRVAIAPCILAAANLHCFFRITNDDDHQVKVYLNSSWYNRDFRLSAVDDQGKMYFADRVELAGEMGNRISPILPPGVPVQGSMTFNNFTGENVALVQFGIQVDGARGEDQPIANLRNIHVEQQEPR